MSNITKAAAQAAQAAGLTEDGIRKTLNLGEKERVGAGHVKSASNGGGTQLAVIAKDQPIFPVELFDLPHPTLKGQVIPRKKALIRTDTDVVLNVVSNSYKLVPHADVFNPVAEAIQEMGLTVTEEKVSMAMDGGYARYTWMLADEDTVLQGDKVRWAVTAWNSYNYESILNLALSAFRLICANGLMAPVNISGGRIGGKHTAHLDVDGALQRLEDLLASEKNVVEEWRRWADVKVVANRFEKVLKDTQDISTKAREAILATFDEGGDNVWIAYNAITWYATHQIVSRADRETITQDLLQRRALAVAQRLAK